MQNEIVQIKPPHKWGGCLAVVTERKVWGVVAYVSIPHKDVPPGRAFGRFQADEIEPLGVAAPFVPADEAVT